MQSNHAYEVQRYKRDELILSTDGDTSIVINVSQKNNMVVLDIEDNGSWIKMEAPQKVVYEFFSNLLNIIYETKDA